MSIKANPKYGQPDERDPTSLCNAMDVRVEHTNMNITVNFDSKTIEGYVTLRARVLKDNSKCLVLDTRNLKIKKVTDEKGENELKYEMIGTYSEVFGQALSVSLPIENAKKDDVVSICVFYVTDPQASAIQWLPPEQTAGKKLPFMFTQCQAIHARSMLPCQDTPGAKMTYEARVTVPKELRALMSSLGNGDDAVKEDDKTKTYAFKQPQATSAYLVALAVGDLHFRSCSQRTGVWAEESVVDKAKYEFGKVEDMVTAAEKICGPYLWGRYDVLCMPPSFPYGGMENPCLTFVTPTLLAGDRSLTDTVVHEITHSWCGNLVTNLSWRHFWLNEGWTMFVQRKIMTLLNNGSEKHSQLDAICRFKTLKDSVSRYGEKHEFTKLIPDLTGVDPDDSFSTVPYEKGFNFLYYLESVIGGPEKMAPFIKAYVKKFSSHPLTSDDFRMFFMEYFSDVDLSVVDWEKWFLGPGMPPVDNKFDRTLYQACADLKTRWLDGKQDGTSIQGWKTTQICVFLDSLQDTTIANNAEKLREMDKMYKFSSRENSEIKFRWQTLCLRAGMPEIIPSVVKFATGQGRMKFTRPLYRDLFKMKEGKEIALKTFKKHRNTYHPICAKMVARDLGLAEKKPCAMCKVVRGLAAIGVIAVAASLGWYFYSKSRGGKKKK